METKGAFHMCFSEVSIILGEASKRQGWGQETDRSKPRRNSEQRQMLSPMPEYLGAKQKLEFSVLKEAY